ncbi:MAG: glucuronate isomerase [Phycisphaerae bacterium]|nr:glucuronate isomerase [Phycisphaerae bacterium]
MAGLSNRTEIEAAVNAALDSSEIVDIHTHLFSPEFGGLLLWGIDEMLTYHYILTEFFRTVGFEIDPERFYDLPKTEQADLIWDRLFVRQLPISESCRGVLTCLKGLGLDPAVRNLAIYRKYFAGTTPQAHLDHVLKLTKIRKAVMTNDPFDAEERPLWKNGFTYDERFLPALRIDTLLVEWPKACGVLAELDYDVRPDLGGKTMNEVRRFLTDWITRMRPVYLAASLPPSFRYPDDSAGTRLLDECVLPVAADHGLAMAMMIGVRRGVNPRLKLAGDALGKSDMTSVANLCTAFNQNRFLITVLGREDQHELAVCARKFHNLHIFGCWWYVNVPSLTEEITRMRIELLGHTFTPQHSDARVLDQLIYKWSDNRRMLARVLTDKYAALAETGFPVSRDEITPEVTDMLGRAAMRFIGRDL